MKWSNRQGHRDRRAWLLLVHGDTVHRFAGEGIPGVVVVVATDYEKNGKWSHTTYQLALAQNVTPISGLDGWETGSFLEGLASATGRSRLDIRSWADVAQCLGVTVPSAREALATLAPKEAASLDRVDAALDELEGADDSAGATTVKLSFGSPTRRRREAGFWERPVVITVDGHEVGRVTPADQYWTLDRLSVQGQVKVLHSQHSPGHGGGYVSLILAVPEGAVATH